MTSPINGSYTPIATLGSNATTANNMPTPQATAELSPDAFLQLMVAQLKYQDPSSPVDTASFMQETATLSQVQTMQALTANSTDSLRAQQVQTATNMVGHTIVYKNSDGDSVSGVVSSATLTGTAPTLTVGGKSVALHDVQQVLADG